MEIKQLIMIFTGYGLKIYEIDDEVLSKLRWNEDDSFKVESDKYDYELCRYYIKYKFEEIVRNSRKSESDLFVYFICALNADNVESVMNDVGETVLTSLE